MEFYIASEDSDTDAELTAVAQVQRTPRPRGLVRQSSIHEGLTTADVDMVMAQTLCSRTAAAAALAASSGDLADAILSIIDQEFPT